MPRTYDQDQFVSGNRGALDVVAVRQERQHGKVEVSVPQLAQKLAGYLSSDFDFDLWISVAKVPYKARQHVDARALIGSDAEPAGLNIMQVLNCRQGLIAQVQQATSIPEQCLARIGEKVAVAIGSIEQWSPNLLFQFAKRNADCRLSAINSASSLVDAALLDSGHKHLQLH
jgi:hypothetical protein